MAHEHHHHDHHHHHHSVDNLSSLNRAFYIGIGVNLLYTVLEYGVGFQTDSLALISDASHNLSDVASLVISLIGLKLAQRTATALYTYGYKKASIFASLINAVLLVSIVIKIVIESIERLISAPELPGGVIMITAGIGIVINGLSAYLFHQGQKEDINVRGAFLHLLVDALVSVGVVVSGGIIALTGWTLADPIISLVIAGVILLSTWSLLSESTKLLLDGVPKQIHKDEIETLIRTFPGVASVHHLHVWALSSAQNALTVHLVLKEGMALHDFQKAELKHALTHHHIGHTTFEIEEAGTECADKSCC